MIIGAELAAWLNDPVRQNDSLRSSRALTPRFAAEPVFADLRRELDQMEVKSAANVQAAAMRFMAREAELDAILDTMIDAAKADPFFEPPFLALTGDIHSGLLLVDEPDLLSIGLGVMPADAIAARKTGASGARSIAFSGLRTIFKFIKSGGARLSFWEADAPGPGFRAAEVRPCRAAGSRRIEDGDVVVIDGCCESFVIEHVEADAVYLQAVIRAERGSLVVEYDSETLEYVGASSTDEAASRIQMMVTLLRLMDRRDAVPLVREMLKSDHFFTRWHVMRELLAMDAEAGLPELRFMAASDPHPEVRSAASRTLDMFFSDAEAKGEACPA